MKKRIGIDLDHTIMTRVEGGTEILFGFKAFVMAQREADAQIFILSHLEDQSRDEAQVRAELTNHHFFNPLDGGGFGFNDDDLVFIHSDNELVAKTKALKLTHYIDTQEAIFQHEAFPTETQPLVLGEVDAKAPTLPDWGEAVSYFEWAAGFAETAGVRLTNIETIKNYGENFVYKLTDENGRHYVLKHFFQTDDERDRLQIEVNHLKVLRDLGMTNVPEPYWQAGGWTIYNWIEGTPVSTAEETHTDQLAQFLIDLEGNRDQLFNKEVQDAGGARRCFQDYVAAVNTKWQKVLKACQRPDGPKDVLLFMMTDMEQMRQDNLNHLYLWCKRENWDRDAAFPDTYLSFNPGDYGIHNALAREDGQLAYFDFDLSGWDDTAHLMADFFHNTEQHLSVDQKLSVLHRVADARKAYDPTFMNRFWAVADLVAVEWVFSILSVVIPEEMRRQQFIDPSIDPKQLIRDRFKMAVSFHEQFKPMEHLCKHSQLLDDVSEIQD